MDAIRESLSRAFDAGRPAQGYVVVGDVRREGRALAEWIGKRLLGESETVATHSHPDMPWFEPEKVSRVIGVDMMRERILPFAQQSALSGGWKIPVIVSADRMRPEAANAFLKTLEEPPPKTLFLLLVDGMADLLPTIVSRCQVLQAGGRRRLDEPWRSQVLGLLADIDRKSVLLDTVRAEALCAVLADMEARAEAAVREETQANPLVSESADTLKALVGARAKTWRNDLLLTLEQWMRDLLCLKAAPGEPPPLNFPEHRETLAARAAVYPLAKLAENLTMLETLATQLDRNITPAHILPYWMDRFYL